MTSPRAQGIPPQKRKHKIRRTHHAEATRNALLEAAEQRFAARGYAGTNMRDIAATANATSGLINRYFGGKEELYLEVQREIARRFARFIQAELEQADGWPRAADDVFQIHARFYREHPTAARLGGWWLLERGDLLIWEGSAEFIETLRASIRAAQERGVISAQTSAVDVYLLSLFQAYGWAHWRERISAQQQVAGEDPVRFEASFERFVGETLRQGLAPSTPAKRKPTARKMQ